MVLPSSSLGLGALLDEGLPVNLVEAPDPLPRKAYFLTGLWGLQTLKPTVKSLEVHRPQRQHPWA